jgi:probable FeS assembly SUF system protein SufT
MSSPETVILSRNVEAALVPAGTEVVLQKGEKASITQALGGSYTVVVNGNMFRIDEKNADALGKRAVIPSNKGAGEPKTFELMEQEVWKQLKTCYDPEIPVNIVDLGLVYSCQLTPIESDGPYRIDVKMTLTAPGCGMGPTMAQDVQKKLISIEGITEANVDLVWDPPWSQSMLSEAARLKLGIY